jgi:uncharacterized protein with PQ loop repeat
MEIFIDVVKWYSVLLLGFMELSIAVRIAACKNRSEGIQSIILFLLLAPVLLFICYLFKV